MEKDKKKKKKKKMEWFWPEKNNGGVILETEDVAAEHLSREGTMSHYSLSGQACHAKETAEKKVEAALAWVEALKASTNAILLRMESLKRVSGKTMVEEEMASFRMHRSLSIKRLVQNEIQKLKQKSEDYGVIRSPKPIRKLLQSHKENSGDKGLINSPRPVRKSVRLSGKFTPVQGGKSRRYSSGNRATPTFFVIKKKKKVPSLVKFFSRKRRKSSLEQ